MTDTDTNDDMIIRLEREGSYLLDKMLREAIGLRYDDYLIRTPTFDDCDGNATDEL
jgi:hypothetical protein